LTDQKITAIINNTNTAPCIDNILSSQPILVSSRIVTPKYIPHQNLAVKIVKKKKRVKKKNMIRCLVL
jgi:hypothetical protein